MQNADKTLLIKPGQFEIVLTSKKRGSVCILNSAF
jgi:hypothetical protein